MSQLHLLEELYRQRIRIDEKEQKKYQGLLKILLDTMITKMKETTPEFNDIYRETYHGGSVFDGLKVGSTEQEFDLNISRKSHANLMQISCKSHAYLIQISGKFQETFRQMSA